MQESYSVYDECILPVLEQGWESIWLLLVYCLVLRLLCLMKAPKYIIHIISFILGCLSLWKFYGALLIYVIGPVFVALLLSFVRRFPGLILAIFSGLYMLAW